MNNMIPRILFEQVQSFLFKKKIILIAGARQVGKTTLLGQLGDLYDKPILKLNGDDADVRDLFQNVTSSKIGSLTKGYNMIFIDEAQRIPDIGLALKIIIDNFPEKQVIATGSSSLQLANNVNEPLTGRMYEFHLFPMSFAEMVSVHGIMNEKRLLENRLLYGYYPEIMTGEENELEILKRLSDAYLYKDIFIFENIKKPQLIEKLLQALALQVGNEVSLSELSRLLNADIKTIERYIDLLEKSYIVFRLPSLNRNMRNEIRKSRKIYFYDNGIRNAIIRNFNPMDLRTDAGALWENFIISERYKFITYQRMWMNRFFWRTHTQQEIDYIEEYNGKLYAFEIKWNLKKKSKIPSGFDKNYPGSDFKVIDKENFVEFLS